MTLAHAFAYRNGWLHCEEVPLKEIAEQVGTPCYVYSKAGMLGNFEVFESAFRDVNPVICYAVKANANLAILKLLKDAGAGFDVVSAGELFRLQRIGADPARIVFSGVGKSSAELQLALDLRILSINVESVEELELLKKLTARGGAPAAVSLRVNPDVDVRTHPYTATGLRQHKFGLDMEQVCEIKNSLLGDKGIRLIGLDFHIGSQILDVQPFIESLGRLRELADDFRRAGFPIEHLDLGGGIGIPYKGEETPDLSRYAGYVREKMGDYRILLEPGRFIVGNAGILLNNVLYRKQNLGKNFVIVDGAMNDLMRPALYQAHHLILPVQERPEEITADVVGPVCESGDFFAKERRVPSFRSGDYLAVMNAGAYGFALSSNYNARPRAAEVLVDGSEFRVIRRRETLEDLIRGEELTS